MSLIASSLCLWEVSRIGTSPSILLSQKQICIYIFTCLHWGSSLHHQFWVLTWISVLNSVCYTLDSPQTIWSLTDTPYFLSVLKPIPSSGSPILAKSTVFSFGIQILALLWPCLLFPCRIVSHELALLFASIACKVSEKDPGDTQSVCLQRRGWGEQWVYYLLFFIFCFFYFLKIFINLLRVLENEDYI